MRTYEGAWWRRLDGVPPGLTERRKKGVSPAGLRVGRILYLLVIVLLAVNAVRVGPTGFIALAIFLAWSWRHALQLFLRQPPSAA